MTDDSPRRSPEPPTRRAWTRRAAALPLMVLVALVTAACAGGSSPAASTAAPPASTAPSGLMTVYADGGTYTSVSPARLTEMLAAKDFTLVNVHVPYEGEIDRTDLFIPYDQVTSRLAELPSAKDAKILVYCRSGRMSTIAAKALVGLGYTNVWELDGGMIAWEAAGFQLVQRPQS